MKADGIGQIIEESIPQTGMLSIVDFGRTANNAREDYDLSDSDFDIPDSGEARDSVKRDPQLVDVDDVERTAKVLMSFGYMGPKLTAGLVKKYGEPIIASVQERLSKTLKQHHGLLGTVYLDGSVCSCKELSAIRKASFHKQTLRYVVGHSDCAHYVDGHCSESGLEIIDNAAQINRAYARKLLKRSGTVKSMPTSLKKAAVKTGDLVPLLRSMFIAATRITEKRQVNEYDSADNNSRMGDIPVGDPVKEEPIDVEFGGVPCKYDDGEFVQVTGGSKKTAKVIKRILTEDRRKNAVKPTKRRRVASSCEPAVFDVVDGEVGRMELDIDGEMPDYSDMVFNMNDRGARLDDVIEVAPNHGGVFIEVADTAMNIDLDDSDNIEIDELGNSEDTL